MLSTGLVPVEEEKEEEDTHAGMELKSSIVSDSGSSDEEQGMMLEPLLSPDEGPKQTVGFSVVLAPPPLFLKVICVIRDSNGCTVQSVPLPTHCLSTCLSKFCVSIV